MKAELIRLYVASIMEQADEDLKDPANAVAALHYGKRLLQFLDDLEDNDQTENNQILR